MNTESKLFDGWISNTTKTCSICNKEKSITDFHIGTKGLYGRPTSRMGKCKECHAEMTLKCNNAKKNQEKPKPNSGYKCPGCGLEGDKLRKAEDWCADHDNTTGLFRGWVCRPCNLIMGNAKDNPETLRRLALFLEKDHSKLLFSSLFES